jgi:hypothetical protein
MVTTQSPAVQRDELQRVRAQGDRAGAARDAAAVQEARRARRPAGVPDGPHRGPAGRDHEEPPRPGLLRLGEAAAQAPRRQGNCHRLQVRRAPEAAGRRVRRRRQHRRPVERHSRRAGGRAHVQAPRPHVLHWLRGRFNLRYARAHSICSPPNEIPPSMLIC